MNLDITYLTAPFLAWLITGILKFIVNTVHTRRIAFDLIGYGGMPSNHSAIVSCCTMLIAIKEGIDNPAFGVALMISFIVVLDAASLRQHIGKQAQAINELRDTETQLRERIGHKKTEILAGLTIGSLIGYTISLF
jgi:acid phosphatase family membrane protein YuiD